MKTNRDEDLISISNMLKSKGFQQINLHKVPYMEVVVFEKPNIMVEVRRKIK